MQYNTQNLETERKSDVHAYYLLPLILAILFFLLGVVFFILYEINRDKAYETADVMINQVESMIHNNDGFFDLINDMPVSNGTTVLIADVQSRTVLASTSCSQIGNDLNSLGITQEFTNAEDSTHFKSLCDGVFCYCSSRIIENTAILIIQNRDVINQNIPIILLTLFVPLVMAAIAITLIVRHMTRKLVGEHINASTDILTGLLNRRSFENEIRQLAGSSICESLVVVSMDLNRLKQINDELGHDAGDTMLREAAACMREQFGLYGKLYRIGGDEFSALLDLNESDLQKAKKRFVENQQEYSLRTGRELSISTGFSRAKDHPDISIQELIKLADNEMYLAKSEYYRQSGVDRRKRS